MRSRPALLLVALWAVTALVATGCSGDSSEASAPPEPETVVEVPLGEVVVETTGPGATVDPEVAEAIRAAVEVYVREGVVATLRGGERGPLSGVFDRSALASLDTPEDAALLDVGAPSATGDLHAVAAPVVLTVLVDESGSAVLISAALALVVDYEADEGAVTITRDADLTFAPTGDGGWRVTIYTASVFRVPDEGVEEPADEGADADADPSTGGTDSGGTDSDGAGSGGSDDEAEGS